jgi:hypothetical protein
VNGVQDSAGALTVSSTIYNNNDPLYIGRGADHSAGSGRDICHCGEAGGGNNKWFWYLRSGGTGFFKGYMSNFRISNSVRYTTTFTPSTIDLTNDANTKLLTLNRNRPLDLSSSARVVTPIGDVRTSNFSPFISTAVWSSSAHGGSAYFDGSGDSLTWPANLNLSNNNFTIEGWFYFTAWGQSAGGNGATLFRHTPGDRFLDLFVEQKKLKLVASGGGVTIDGFLGTTTLQLNTWTHIALVRNGTTFTAYINGVAESIPVTGVSSSFSNMASVTTGAGDNSTTGYVSDLRVVNGTAVYTTGFTPPTTPLTAITNTTTLLNHTNGAIVDSSTRNVLETVGNTQVSTSVKKYGTGSLAFDGTGDYLKLNPSPILNFGTGDFTIEFWAYRTNTSAQFPFTQSNIGSGGRSGVAIGWDGSNRFWWLFGDNSNWVFERFAGTTPSINTWFHVAVVRDSGTARLYLNGVQIDSLANSTDLSQTSNISYIGGNIDGFGVNGYLDDFRITDGFSRYPNGTTFTPPASAFPRR